MVTSITPPTITKSLSSFQNLGHATYLYAPSTAAKTASAPLILLFTWMGAAPKHIAKYTLAYQRLFPTSRILLIRCELRDVFQRSSVNQGFLGPSLDVVRAHVLTGGEILLHSFSNGGGILLVEFASLYLSRTGEKLRVRAQAIDSAPGKGDWKRSHAAILVSLPKNLFVRLFGSVLLHFFLAVVWLVDKTTRREKMMLRLFRQLNDGVLFEINTPRVYLYSLADLMVGAEDVEEHAELARKAGWEVELVRFEKSPHAGHILEDEARYWGAIMKAWERGA